MKELTLVKEFVAENEGYEMKDYSIKGYNVRVVIQDEKVEEIVLRKCERFLPEISWSGFSWDKKEREFRIQTTAYGSLEVDQIQEVIKGYQTAIEVVEILKKILSK